MSASEEIKARYAKKAERVDAFGRRIVVRRLRPSEQMTIVQLAGTSDQTILSMMSAAFAIVSIDDTPFPQPKSRAEAEQVLDLLDNEGLIAVTEAIQELQPGGMSVDEAKNSSETSGSSPAAG